MAVSSQIPPFRFKIDDAFAFENGVTVLTGTVLDGDIPHLAPCRAELVIAGQTREVVELESERMPGSAASGQRVVETRSRLPISEIRAGDALLVHRP